MGNKFYFIFLVSLVFCLPLNSLQAQGKLSELEEEEKAAQSVYDKTFLRMSESYEMGDMQAVVDTFRLRCLRNDGKRRKKVFGA